MTGSTASRTIGSTARCRRRGSRRAPAASRAKACVLVLAEPRIGEHVGGEIDDRIELAGQREARDRDRITRHRDVERRPRLSSVSSSSARFAAARAAAGEQRRVAMQALDVARIERCAAADRDVEPHSACRAKARHGDSSQARSTRVALVVPRRRRRRRRRLHHHRLGSAARARRSRCPSLGAQVSPARSAATSSTVTAAEPCGDRVDLAEVAEPRLDHADRKKIRSALSVRIGQRWVSFRGGLFPRFSSMRWPFNREGSRLLAALSIARGSRRRVAGAGGDREAEQRRVAERRQLGIDRRRGLALDHQPAVQPRDASGRRAGSR